jgi:hypothetical protein
MANHKGNIVGKTGKHYMLTKAALRKRLEEEGRWGQFVAERRRLKKETKLIDPLIWIGAAQKFKPLDGRPPEFTQEDYDVRVGLQMTSKTPSAMRGLGKNALTQEEIADQQIQMVALSNGDKLRKAKEAMWRNLLNKVSNREKRKTYVRPTVSEELLWVYQYAGTPPEECEGPHLPPSRGALRMYKECVEGTFYQEIARIVINKFASKDEDVTGHGIRKDKEKKLELMERLEDYDPEVLDDVELAEAFAEQEKSREAGELYDDDEEEFGFGEDDEEDEDDEDFGSDEETAPIAPAEPIADQEAVDVEVEGGDADPAQ